MDDPCGNIEILQCVIDGIYRGRGISYMILIIYNLDIRIRYTLYIRIR